MPIDPDATADIAALRIVVPIHVVISGTARKCPDNQYCIAGRPRSAAARPPAPTTDSSHAVVLEFSGKVVGVNDGDTITVMHGQVGEKIRLNGIDCPERGQPYGKRAKQAVSALVFGRDVILQTHGQDKYLRTLSDVLLRDGTNINHELVKDGWCWWYRKYAPGDTRLERLEKDAREAKKGLWADPPWEGRKAE